MPSEFTIKELTTLAEMEERFSLVKQLNPKLEKDSYSEMLNAMLKNGYRMIAAFKENECVGVSGFWIATKIYSGKYVELDNVITDENYRSKGIGKLLSDWIIEEAKKQRCKVAMLDAYVENYKGHRFYFREGFTVRGFHFIKKI